MKTRNALCLMTTGLAVCAANLGVAQTWYLGTTNANSITQEGLWQSAVGAYNLENFDSYTPGTPFGNITTVGLTVQTYTDTTQAIVWTGGSTFTRSGDQFLWNTNHRQTWFTANGPMTAFAYWAAGGDSDVHHVTLFDSSMALIGTNTVVAEPSLPCFIGVTTTTNIGFILVEFGGNGGTQDSIALDDIQTNAVPEPMSLAVLAVGGALVVRRRRKRLQGT